MSDLTDAAPFSRSVVVTCIVVLVGVSLGLLGLDWLAGQPARRLKRAFLTIVAEFHPAPVNGFVLSSLLERRLGKRPSPRAFDAAAEALIDTGEVRWYPYGEACTHQLEGEYVLGDAVLRRFSKTAARQSA